MTDNNFTRCGFIAVIGAPNAGKSTLINGLVGTKVSIVSHKVQTTRIKIMGIATRGNNQLVFIDTPGIFEPRRRLDRAMVDAAWRGVFEADMLMLVVDAKRGIDADTSNIMNGLRGKNLTANLVLNKIDLINREKLLSLAKNLNDRGVFEETFMISALKGDGLDDLMHRLSKTITIGPWMFPANQLCDLPQQLAAAEVTREYIMLLTHQEVPYVTTVETQSWEEFRDGSVKIVQFVYVRQNSQKAIILGNNGTRVKEIGTAARTELRKIFNREVHLFIHIKVRRNWMERRSHYEILGLNFKD